VPGKPFEILKRLADFSSKSIAGVVALRGIPFNRLAQLLFSTLS